MKLYFIVGMSRSGTTWLTRSLNKHSKITAFGETCFFGRNDIGKPNYDYENIKFLKKKLRLLDEFNKTGNLFKLKVADFCLYFLYYVKYLYLYKIESQNLDASVLIVQQSEVLYIICRRMDSAWNGK